MTQTNAAPSRSPASPPLHPHAHGHDHGPDNQAGRSVCWNCEKTIADEDVCPSCVRVQPFGEARNYYNILDVPERLALDPGLLTSAYHEKSRLFHPDHHVGDSEKEQEISLANASLVNLAFRTLRDPFLRARYYVARRRGEAGRPTRKASLPPAVLMEIMDLREEVQSLAGGGNLPEATARVRAVLDPLDNEIFSSFDGVDSIKEGSPELPSALDLLSERLERRSYIQNLLAELKEKSL